jgi:addiction module RelE/StbE family toxin
MKLRLTPQATKDLAEIADYIRAESPNAARHVRASILESLRLVADFPGIGRRQNAEGVRKHVSRRYGYLLYYTVDREADEVAVVAIRHSARQRLFVDR